ncbi:MAG: RNA polymerase II mediator complex subunit [Phylliscum demangeonii]|nr:MAG: RNA polymerase II mediator complex subunit [Phylliscum demangeonii]
MDSIENQLQEIIQDLYEISVQVYAYHGHDTSAALIHKMCVLSPSPSPASTTLTHPPSSKALTHHLSDLSTTAPLQLPVSIPPEIVEYVESGRNPDIYTREFVELVQRGNEHLRGKSDAFAAFRDVLAQEVRTALPALRHQVDRVVRETGERVAINEEEGEGQAERETDREEESGAREGAGAGDAGSAAAAAAGREAQDQDRGAFGA